MKSNKIKTEQNEDKNIVLKLSKEQFEELLETIKEKKEVKVTETKSNTTKNKIKEFMPVFIRIFIGTMFLCFGLLMIVELSNNIRNYWNGTFANGLAVVIIYFISVGIMGCGISIYFEKDKNYIIGVASLFVAFVALLVAFIN